MEVFELDYNALRESVRYWSAGAGRVAAMPVTLMWFVMCDKMTPRRDKTAIFLSLTYHILPLNVMETRNYPVVRWLDKVCSMSMLLQQMSAYITPEIERQAQRQLDKWFGSIAPAAYDATLEMDLLSGLGDEKAED
ncbi:MAG: hypothetical protein NC328_00810 [Muribaculum sp.]|nr:hypothetical protein [Muribaculum sp.]